MERYCKRELAMAPSLDNNGDGSSETNVRVNLQDLPKDPGLRPRISDYDPAIRDEVRRAYLLKGPCQPRDHNYPYKKFGQVSRRFVPTWFDEYPEWLEYSTTKDAAFCLCCYLFKSEIGGHVGSDSFINEGFSNWKKKEKFRIHVGGPNSTHNQAWSHCEALLQQNQLVQYRTHLNAGIDCVRFLLRQGLPIEYVNEFFISSNEGNFYELLRLLANYNEDLDGAAENLKLTSPNIQRDIVRAFSTESVNAIVREMDGALFSLLIDGSLDNDWNLQMVVILRYVNKSGHVVERFISLEQITSITDFSLKTSLDKLFSRLGLSMSKLRGQGYNGASCIPDMLNNLKTLIMKENECAYYTHCFANQLQSVLVTVARNHFEVQSLFSKVAKLVNIIEDSSMHHHFLEKKQALLAIPLQAVNSDGLSSGHDLNQVITMNYSDDTRWGSYYDTLVHVTTLFSSLIDTLEIMADDKSNLDQSHEARTLLDGVWSLVGIWSFDFVFSLHLMKGILAISNELSQALQRRDQDIVNAMKLVATCKQRLQIEKVNGWDSLLGQVSSFCVQHGIDMPNMDDKFPTPRRSQRIAQEVTNLHHYRNELFYGVLDLQLQELEDRFSDVSTELLLCVACLCPDNSFAAFNKQKIVHFAKFYPKEFSMMELMALEMQLESYIMDVSSSIEFSELKGISDLARRMVETKKDRVYPSVYLLITLALILPITTPTIERAFSAMTIAKNKLQEEMTHQWMNDHMVVHIEQDIFDRIDNEAIMQCLHSMKCI